MSGQPDLTGGILAHGRGLKLGAFPDTLQPKLSYDSVISSFLATRQILPGSNRKRNTELYNDTFVKLHL